MILSKDSFCHFKFIFVILLLFYNHSSIALTRDEAIRFFNLNPKHEIIFLDIKGYQQTEDYSCGPAAVMSVLHYYGILNDKQMNKRTELRIASEMHTSKDTGTSAQQMTDWLLNHGFDVKTGNDGTIKMLRGNLAKGIPTMVDWIDWGGHWVATAGYDSSGKPYTADKDTLFFADPSAHFDNIKTKDGITFINPDRFADMWFDSNHNKNIYIVAIPKKLH